MIWTYLMIYWVVLGVMILAALSFKNYQNHQVLSVTLSKEHSGTPEVQEISRRYRNACLFLFFAFVILSFLMFWKPIKPFIEFYMLFLTFAHLIVLGAVGSNYMNKLRTLKEEKHWIYSPKQSVVIDTEASKEKGKSAVPIFWSWIFVFLSFLPMIYLILNPDVQERYPLLFTLIGPVCQLFMLYLRRLSLSHHTPALSDNSEINKACARTEERINSMAATLAGLVLSLFWILFSASIVRNANGITVILVVLAMAISLVAIIFWQHKKIRRTEEYFFENELGEDKDIYEQDNLWKAGFYNNPNDSRLMVPKRIASMGWTVNIGHPAGKAILIGTGILIFGLLITLFAGSMIDYKVEEENSQITVSSSMYRTSFDADDIVSVEKITDIPHSIRTNGYGGASKSFGHFQVDGYGSCMFYLYNDIPEYIVIELEGDDPPYVFTNDKTLEKTDELYEYFISMIE